MRVQRALGGRSVRGRARSAATQLCNASPPSPWHGKSKARARRDARASASIPVPARAACQPQLTLHRRHHTFMDVANTGLRASFTQRKSKATSFHNIYDPRRKSSSSLARSDENYVLWTLKIISYLFYRKLYNFNS